MITLYDWQKPHAERLKVALQTFGLAFDLSGTGAGKTYIAAHLAKWRGGPAYIICPKALIPQWQKVWSLAELTPAGIMNIERAKRGHGPIQKTGSSWQWSLAPGTLVIFDEVHGYGGKKTGNAAILAATRAARLPVLGLSATLANNPLRLRAIGLLMNWFPTWGAFWPWALEHGAERGTICARQRMRNGKYRVVVRNVVNFNPASQVAATGLAKINKLLYDEPVRASRLVPANIPGFPKNIVMTEPFRFSQKVVEAYQELGQLVSEAVAEGEVVQLAAIIKLRQHAEELKAGELSGTIEDHMEEGGVVIVVNFIRTADVLIRRFNGLDPAVITGQNRKFGVSDDREAQRLKFQSNKTPLCIVTFDAGGVGLDLQDLYGVPRQSILFPTWSARALVQALGRISRADALSPAVQHIMYAAGTVEDRVAARVQTAIKNMDTLQDQTLLEIK